MGRTAPTCQSVVALAAVILASGASVGAATHDANRSEPARQRFHEATSFCTYYGSGKVAELSRYDIAVIHTPQMSKADVAKLRDQGVVVVGYLTIGEDEKLQLGNGQGPGGNASWYFDGDHDNRADQDGVWKSWYANVNDDQWRASRVARAKRLVEDYGCDGVFLDLISVSELYPECRPGMIQMMRDLRQALPESVIVMNQGFDIVAKVATLADGFMIESFTATYNFDKKNYALNSPAELDFHLRRAQKILAPVVAEHGLRVLVLDYAEAADRESIQFAANRAASLGFLFSASPILLDDVYADIPAGEVDPKWLRMHATPDKLALKLTAERNGFPAGTALTPSGCFAGYTVAPLVNPATDRSGLSWGEAAWASSEDSDPAWIQIDLPAGRVGGSLAIDWQNGAVSRQFVVQVRENASTAWQDVETVKDNRESHSTFRLPREKYQQLRIFQSEDGGSAGRPNLMWIARLALAD